MKMMKISVMAMLAGGVAAYTASAAGFGIYQASARGIAVGDTLVGSTGDASANYYNPANLTEVEGTATKFGVTVIAPRAKVDYGRTGDKVAAKNQYFYVPHLFASHQLSEQFWMGLGLYSEFGLGTAYPKDWVGQEDSLKTDLTTVTFNPNVAWKICDKVSVAAGLRVMYLDILIRKTPTSALPPVPGFPPALSIPTEMRADSIGYGYVLGVTVKPIEDLSIGLVYRSSVRQNAEGDVEYSVNPQNVASMLGMTRTSGTVKGSLTFPESVILGANYKATEDLALGVALTWTRWSRFDALTMHLRNYPSDGAMTTSSEPKNWSNVMRYSVGLEYSLSDAWTLMAGYIHDRDPINLNYADAKLPAGNRNLFNLGLGWSQGSLTVNGSVGCIFMKKTSGVNPSGIPIGFSDGISPMAALSVGKTF